MLPGIDEAADIIRGGAAGHPWAERVPKLFFMGEAHGGQRLPAWELLKRRPGKCADRQQAPPPPVSSLDSLAIMRTPLRLA